MEFGAGSNRKILLISSSTPFASASRMVLDMIDAFTLGGYDITFLTKYKDLRFTEKMHGILEQPKNIFFSNSIYRKLYYRLKGIVFRLSSIIYNLNSAPPPEYYFLDKYDDREIVSADSIIEVAGRTTKYDFIFLFATHNMLSFKNIEELYDFYRCPIMISAPDMYPFTGGCHYFNDCRKFESGCGKCPALLSYRKDDCSNHNALYKEGVYSKCNIALLCNSFMMSFAEKSSIISKKQLFHSYPVINETVFKPCEDKGKLRDKLGILRDSFVIFVGATTLKERRKGYVYLKQALNDFVSRLSMNEQKKVILCVAGKTSIDCNDVSVNIKFVGYLSYEQLAEYFAISDIHLSSTIQDAGPMMVNQSLACGTPVVCFKIGTAIDVIKKFQTGYAADLYDAKGLSFGIDYFYHLSEIDRFEITKKCRDMAIKTTSYSAFVHTIDYVYSRIEK